MEDNGSKNGRTVSKRSGRRNSGRGRAKPSVLADTVKLLEFLKENKIESFKNENIEVKFSQLAFLPKEVFEPKSEVQPEDTDELLFYSAPERG